MEDFNNNHSKSFYPPDPPYPKDAKLLQTDDEALNILGISLETVDRIPIAPGDDGKTLEQRRAAHLHWIRKVVNYAIMAQGNGWVIQNRERMLKQLKLDAYSLANPQRCIPDTIQTIDDVLALLDVDRTDLSREALESLSVQYINDIIQREGKKWVRANSKFLLYNLETWADLF